MKYLFIIIGVLLIHALFTDNASSAFLEVRRYEEMQCEMPDPPYKRLFVVGQLDGKTGMIVKRVAIVKSGSYILLVNPDNDDEYRELYWSHAWRCLHKRHIK